MLQKGEWEPDPYIGIGTWPPHIVVRAQCAKCGHSGDVDERSIARLPRTMLVVHFVNRLSCRFCPQGKGTGRITIYLRKKPRG